MTPDTIYQAAKEAREALAKLIEAADSMGNATNCGMADEALPCARSALARLDTALASEGKEPVAWLPADQLEFLRAGNYRQATVTNYSDEVGNTPLYATPPAKEPEAASLNVTPDELKP